MITTHSLERAGFTVNYWEELEDNGGKYRTWMLPVQSGVWIEVDEEEIYGKQRTFIPSIYTEEGEYIFLKLDTVTQLLQLKDLLS